MKYIKLFETPDGTYQPDIQEIIFNEINYPISGSYILFFPRLFNLSYADFMRMVRDRYNATLKGKSSYMTFIFKNKQDCNVFIDDCEKRFLKWRNNNVR